jgi:hypothetical protein
MESKPGGTNVVEKESEFLLNTYIKPTQRKL